MKTKAIVLTAAGSALLAPLLSGPAAHAAAAATTSGSRTTATAKGAAKAETGCADPTATAALTGRHLTARSVEDLAGGGHTYLYQVGAHRLSFGVPSASFDALKATDAQLRAYGLPPRPAGAAARARWVTFVGHLGHVVTPDVTIRAALPDNLPRLPKTTTPEADVAGADGFGGVSTATTSIWAGYVSKESSSSYYGNVEGSWVEPSISSSSCSGATHLTWVGIGGYNSQQLLQDGTDQNNRPWFEYLGNNGTGVNITSFPTNITIKSGDTVEAITEYTGGTAYYLVEDETTGQTTTASVSGASPYYDGSSAEFIDERTSFGTARIPSPLADFGVTHWTEAQAATTSAYKSPQPLSSLTNVTQLSMLNGNDNHTLAVPENEGFGGYTFETSWKNCS
jgi:hypothetical protein